MKKDYNNKLYLGFLGFLTILMIIALYILGFIYMVGE